MPKRVESGSQPTAPRRNPAKTPEGREQQLIDAAVTLAERQLLEGTASAQVITHYLKLGSSRERLEQQRLEQEAKLTEAKIEQLGSQKAVEELYAKALGAMSRYSGDVVVEQDYDDPELQ